MNLSADEARKALDVTKTAKRDYLNFIDIRNAYFDLVISGYWSFYCSFIFYYYRNEIEFVSFIEFIILIIMIIFGQIFCMQMSAWLSNGKIQYFRLHLDQEKRLLTLGIPIVALWFCLLLILQLRQSLPAGYHGLPTVLVGMASLSVVLQCRVGGWFVAAAIMQVMIILTMSSRLASPMPLHWGFALLGLVQLAIGYRYARWAFRS